MGQAVAELRPRACRRVLRLAFPWEVLGVADQSGVYSLTVLMVTSGLGAARAVSSLVRAWGPLGPPRSARGLGVRSGRGPSLNLAQLVRSRAGSRDHGSGPSSGSGGRVAFCLAPRSEGCRAVTGGLAPDLSGGRDPRPRVGLISHVV